MPRISHDCSIIPIGHSHVFNGTHRMMECKQLPQLPTANNIELRLCAGSLSRDEDVPIEHLHVMSLAQVVVHSLA